MTASGAHSARWKTQGRSFLVRGARSNKTREKKNDWENFRVLKRGFQQNSDSDMRTFRSCDVNIFETQTGTVRSSLNADLHGTTL